MIANSWFGPVRNAFEGFSVFLIGNARRGITVCAALLGCALPATATAQVLSLARQFEGRYDYVVTGNSHRSASNSSNACSVNESASATLGLPAGATVVAAYLYWAGSGSSVDNQVTFAGPAGSVSTSALGTFTSTFSTGSTNYPFFGAFSDVTPRVTGGGSYSVSNLSVATGNPHCSSSAVVKGWALFVVYSRADLPVKRIQLRHGLRAFRRETEQVALSGFLASNAPDARVTFLLYEGDEDIPGSASWPEQLLFNGAPFTDALNPANNPYNSTVNTPAPGRGNVHGLDLDTYDASAFFAPRSRSATVDLTAGDDMVILQAILTSLSVALADVTPDGLAAPERRLPGRYGRVFQVENPSLATDDFDLLSRFSGASGVVLDSITGAGVVRGARPDSARVQLAAGARRDVTVWYTLQTGPPMQSQIHLRARSVAYPSLAAAQDTGYTQLWRTSPQLTLSKSVSPSDVVAPGTDLTYALQFANAGDYAASAVVVRDSVPAEVVFKVGALHQSLPAGIAATAAFSADGATWTYSPASGGCGAPAGYDACVRHIRWTLQSDLPAGPSQSTGTLGFVARVR